MPLADKSDLKQSVAQLPLLPGVYFFKDADGTILYVGKAKQLKKRVASYLKTNHSDWKTASLMEVAVAMDHRVTDTELDALVLEANLIRTHKPPFNVLLRDSTPFLYFYFPRITPKNDLPMFQLIRGRNDQQSGTWIGPFLSSSHARKLFHVLTERFQLRICGKKMPNGCLYFHMKQCSGSCRDSFDKDAYLQRFARVKKLCRVGPKSYLRELDQQITAYNNALEFEQARSINNERETIVQAFDHLPITQTSDTVYEVFSRGSDIWILDIKASYLHVYNAHRNNLIKLKTFVLDDVGIDQTVYAIRAEECFQSYYRDFPIPQSIFANFGFQDVQLIEQFFNLEKETKTTLVVIDTINEQSPDIVQLAFEMAQQESRSFMKSATGLQRLLKTDNPLCTVDCFDISHKSGTDVVAACIRFSNGKPVPNKFRRFKMMSDVGNNDYANLQEAVSRRYRGGKDVPDLILIDGGKGQLSAVKDLVPGALFASLAKREERVFAASLPKSGHKLDEHSIVGRLLIALRDYTHHFAISYHRKLSTKHMSK